jgi:hypothetical protein
MKLLSFTTAAALLLAAAPAQAQPITTAPSTWQITDACWVEITEVDTTTPARTQTLISKDKCHGISVSVKNNTNVHFEYGHPQLRNTIMSYALTPGPYQGEHPIDMVVAAIGTKHQVVAESEEGRCRMKPMPSDPTSTLLTCIASTRTLANGKYTMISSYALFTSPVAPEIRQELK